jgi:calcineurin-like phosphoesterase family protein
MSRFFTSDLHFGHKNVIEFCNRPFKDVEEMDAELIRRWNVVVKENDEIFILGDMFFCGKIRAKEILNQLNGKKNLIMGNHDWGKLKKHRAEEFGLNMIVDSLCIRLAGKDVKLSHFPYKGSGDHMDGEDGKERFSEYRYQDEGGWLLHGHVHDEWLLRGKQINVGVDVWSYAPVSEYELIEIINR